MMKNAEANRHMVFSQSDAYETTSGSKYTCIPSVGPVAPEHTCSYVGSASAPCVYPTHVAATPGRRWK